MKGKSKFTVPRLEVRPQLNPIEHDEVPPLAESAASPAAEVIPPGPWQCTINLGAVQLLTVVDGLQALIKYSIAGDENEEAAKVAGQMLSQLVPMSRQAFAVLRQRQQLAAIPENHA